MNVVELFASHEASSVALICGGQHHTYGEMRDRVSAARAVFASRYETGNNIVVMGDTSIDFIETVFAALSAGLPVVPLHARMPASEISRAIEIARPALVVTTDHGSASLAKELAVPSAAAAEFLDVRSDEQVAPVNLDADHPALLIFTSGTAGHPRIAVLSHGNIAAAINSASASAPSLAQNPQRVLGVMPLTHVLGIVSVVGVTISVGSTVVLAEDVAVGAIADAVAEHQVTFLVAPPVFWYRLATSEVGADKLSSIKAAISGAAPLSGSVAATLADRYDIKLRQGYGLTEASPGLTSSIGTEAPPTSVGRPMPGVRLRLVDEFGDDALVGDVGEIWAKGPNIFSGYLGDDEATASVIDEDGWLHTGDLAVVDENGFVYIVGRNKDQIIVSGFNVHPGEVEDRLSEHPSVEAAAVVGAPDREYGEVVVAYVVPARGGTPDADVLEAHCRTRLAGYKVPARFEVVDELPRSATGKLRRRVLRS